MIVFKKKVVTVMWCFGVYSSATHQQSVEWK